MAGERRGKCLEAIVRYALSQNKGRDFPASSEIIWDGPTSLLAWKPDLFVPPTGSFEGLLLLVTFSGSETDSRQKFWRNLAEYFDARTNHPRMIGMSILAGARVRDKLLETQKHVFNGVIELEKHASATLVRKWLVQIAKAGKEPIDLLDAAADLAKTDKAFLALCKTITDAIRTAISTAPNLHHSFWDISPSQPQPIPTSRVTHFRRGVAKSLLLEPTELSPLRARKPIPAHPRHDALLRSGILKKSIRGNELVDHEVRFAIDNVTHLASILSSEITDVGLSCRERLWNLSTLEEAIEWCAVNWKSIGEAGKLATFLRKAAKGRPEPERIYLALKVILAKRLGKQGQEWLEDVVDATGEMRSVLVGLYLPRFERGQDSLSAEVVDAMASALSSRCAKVTALQKHEIDAVLDDFISDEIEMRLTCHGIDPVGAIVRNALSEAGINYREGRLPSGLAERLGYPERDLGTGGLIAGTRTFIHWKTVSDSGRDHKVKELCARAFQGVRQWTGNRYIKRVIPSLTILVVDGTWRQEDLSRLHAAGWHKIVYADEIQAMIAAII